MTGLIGRKLGMTQFYNPAGNAVPVTVIEAGPCVVVQKKEVAKDGYTALQVGFGSKKAQRVNKPAQGHMAKAGKGAFEVLKEFRVADVSSYEIGQEIKAADLFKAIAWRYPARPKGTVFQESSSGGPSAAFRGRTARTNISATADPLATAPFQAESAKERKWRDIGEMSRFRFKTLRSWMFDRKRISC